MNYNKLIRRSFSAFLAVLTVFYVLYVSVQMSMVQARADEITAFGCITPGTTSVRIRTSPSTAGTDNVITMEDGGFELDIYGESFHSGDYDWYNVGFYYYGEYRKGYVVTDYVTVYRNIDYSQYESFSQYLDAQGFPESYKNELLELHARYPRWIFVADKTGIDWNYAVSQESSPGRSLVPYYFNSETKSTAAPNYDWGTGEYTMWDSGGWVQASDKMIMYAMDPRNFLSEQYIFMFENLAYNAQTQNASGLTSLVGNTFLAQERSDLSYGGVNYSNYVSALMAAGSISGVSPYHLAARIIQEMGTSGESNSISGTLSGYEGLYNYYNIGAYKTDDAGAIENGLKRARSEGWTTRMAAIVGGASFIGNGYINRGQNTLYYEKFDLNGFWHQYMTNILGARSEAVIASRGYSMEMKQNTPLVFNIPVFDNMPASACEYPDGDGSPNNRLSILEVSELEFTPSFSYDVLHYEMTVPFNVTSVNVSGSTVDSKAVVSGFGRHELSVGSNDITISVTAENGDVLTYTITVVREDKPLNGLHKNDEGEWHYYKDSVIDMNFIGVASNEYGKWVVSNGRIDTEYDGLIYDEFQEEFCYVEAGKIIDDYEGLCYSRYDGNFWAVVNGKVDFDYEGICYSKYDGNFWAVVDGKVDFDYEGICYSKYDGNFWAVVDGKVDFDYEGISYSRYDGNFWAVVDGKVDFDYEGISYSRYDENFWAVVDGKVDFGYHGIAYSPYDNNLYYIEDGKVNFDFTGSCEYMGIMYNIYQGRVQ